MVPNFLLFFVCSSTSWSFNLITSKKRCEGKYEQNKGIIGATSNVHSAGNISTQLLLVRTIFLFSGVCLLAFRYLHVSDGATCVIRTGHCMEGPCRRGEQCPLFGFHVHQLVFCLKSFLIYYLYFSQLIPSFSPVKTKNLGAVFGGWTKGAKKQKEKHFCM